METKNNFSNAWKMFDKRINLNPLYFNGNAFNDSDLSLNPIKDISKKINYDTRDYFIDEFKDNSKNEYTLGIN